MMASSPSEQGPPAATKAVGPGTSEKSEKEKMLAGELYSPLQNPELKALHRIAVKVVNEFNATPLDEEERRAELMKVRCMLACLMQTTHLMVLLPFNELVYVFATD